MNDYMKIGESRLLTTDVNLKFWEDVFIGPSISKTGAWEIPVTQYIIGAILTISDWTRGDFTFLDMGAHVGYYSSLASYYMPKGQVHAFEPNTNNLELLRKNVKRFPNCVVHPYALDTEEKKADFWYPEDESGGGSLYYDSIVKKEGLTKCEVETKKITSFGIDFSKVGIIKLDIQGKEPEIIKELTKTNLRSSAVVVIEAAEENMKALAENNFRTFATIGNSVVANKL